MRVEMIVMSFAFMDFRVIGRLFELFGVTLVTRNFDLRSRVFEFICFESWDREFQIPR